MLTRVLAFFAEVDGFPGPMNFQNQNASPRVLSGRNVTAILGPTNTGKTHLAIERMVAHSSGIIACRCACLRARSIRAWSPRWASIMWH